MKKVLGLAATIVVVLLPAIILGSVTAESTPKISVSPDVSQFRFCEGWKYI